MSEGIRDEVKSGGTSLASHGGIESKLTQPLSSLPKYSMKQRMIAGDPEAYQAAISDMDMRTMLREYGALTPQVEGNLAERLSTTPQGSDKQLDEIFNWLGPVLSPIFRMKPKAP